VHSPTDSKQKELLMNCTDKVLNKRFLYIKDDSKSENERFDIGETDSVTDGVATGKAIGGAAGLAAGDGMLAIPGISSIIAMRPIAELLAGTVTASIAGGLIDLGIPAEESKKYEEKIKKAILW